MCVEEWEMGLQRKIQAGIETQVQQPCRFEPHSFGAPFTTRLRKQERQCRIRDRHKARPCREGKGLKGLTGGL